MERITTDERRRRRWRQRMAVGGAQYSPVSYGWYAVEANGLIDFVRGLGGPIRSLTELDGVITIEGGYSEELGTLTFGESEYETEANAYGTTYIVGEYDEIPNAYGTTIRI